jgi:site-specific DNA-methyltransferase (adenine-specific)
MNDIEPGSVDMILCDLPYGTTSRNKWDVVIPFAPLWDHYRRIAKPNAAIVLFGQLPFAVALGASNLEWLRYEWIWEKTQATGFLNSKRAPLKAHENVLVFYRSQPTYNPQKRPGQAYTATSGQGSKNYREQKSVVTVNTGERFPTSVLKFPHDRPRLHPTQKPVALCEYLIRTYTNAGDVVLDNCMGSGSTIIGAINSGRQYIGIEQDPDIFKIAERRIAGTLAGTAIDVSMSLPVLDVSIQELTV